MQQRLYRQQARDPHFHFHFYCSLVDQFAAVAFVWESTANAVVL
jgi:hypothetical protein